MSKKESNKTTSFGFETVTEEVKTEKVKEVFDSVATNYDLMNDMSLWECIGYGNDSCFPKQD